MSCLEKLVVTQTDDSTSPTINAIIIDGAAIVNMLKPGAAQTFSDYSSQVFLPYIKGQLQAVQRLDLVWDEYIHGSLEEYTCSTIGEKEVAGM